MLTCVYVYVLEGFLATIGDTVQTESTKANGCLRSAL